MCNEKKKICGQSRGVVQASVVRKVEAAIQSDIETLKSNRRDEGTVVKQNEKQLREELAKLQDAGAQGSGTRRQTVAVGMVV